MAGSELTDTLDEIKYSGQTGGKPKSRGRGKKTNKKKRQKRGTKKNRTKKNGTKKKKSKSSKKKTKKDCVKFKEGDIVYKPPMAIPGTDRFINGKVGTVVSISKNCKWYLVIFNTGRSGIGMYSPKFYKDIVIATDAHKIENPPNDEDPPLDAEGVEYAKKEFHRINDNRDV